MDEFDEFEEPGFDLEPSEAFDWGDQSFFVEGEGDEADVLRFEAGGRLFAVAADAVAEVVAPMPLTDVPGLPAHIRGVAVRRRNVLSVVDLEVLLELEVSGQGRGRWLVFESDGLEAAFSVADVTGLEVWPEDEESATLLENLDESIRRFATDAQWAPGGVVVMLDATALLQAAAVR